MSTHTAPSPLPEPLVAELREHKAEVLRLLLPCAWDAADFRTFFGERAGVLEHEYELDRSEAEKQAFEATVIQWINLTPPTDIENDRCAECGEDLGRIGTDAVPVLTGGGNHVWLHHHCHAPWQAQRRQEAIMALNAMGIAS